MKKRYPITMLNEPHVKCIDDKYACDMDGNVYAIRTEHLYKLKPRYHNSSYVVYLHGKERGVMRIIAEAFLQPLKKGETRYHINGNKADNKVSNIGIITQKELGKRIGYKSGRKVVERIDKRTGESKFYRSLRDAAEDNYYSASYLSTIINGKYRQGERYVFRYDDDD